MTLKNIFISLGLLSGCSLALAAVKDVSVNTETASAVIQETTGGLTTYSIFGGYAGTGGSCGSTSTSAVCNSCTDLSPCEGTGTVFQCAQRSIHPTLQLAITMTVDTVPTTPRVLIHWGTDTSDTINAAGTVPIPVANQPFTVFINWSDLCENAGLTTACSVGEGSGDLNVGVQDGTTGTFASGASQKFRVVVRAVTPTTNENLSPDSEPDSTMGFSDFKVLPGDSKVYVSEVHRGNVGPESETKWQAMRVYYGEATPDPYTTPTSLPTGANFCTDIDYTSSNFVDLPVESKTAVDTRLTEAQVKGLENEKTYLFNIASVDEATIVTGFLKTDDLNVLPDQSQYVARPGEVVGLLANKECFIATAAFGSPAEGHVETLRKFRNQFLVNNSLGRKFVRFYYKYSPPVAEFISQNEIAKAVIRWALWPLILFAEASLAIGFLNTVLGFAVLMLGLALIILKQRRAA